MFKDYLEFSTAEEGIEKLNQTIQIRNSMGGCYVLEYSK